MMYQSRRMSVARTSPRPFEDIVKQRPEQLLVPEEERKCTGGDILHPTSEDLEGLTPLLDKVYIEAEKGTQHDLCPQDSTNSVGRLRDNIHFVYGDSKSVDPSYSDHSTSWSDSEYNDVLVKSCISAFANIIGRRVARAMIELVGIEPNPGPGLDRLVNGLTTALTQSNRKGNKSSGKKKRGARQPSNQSGQNKMGLKVRSEINPGSKSGLSDYQKYVRVLSNPFDNVPVRLGGENMQPSGIATLVWRGLVPGNCSMVFYPWARNPLLISTTTAAPYVYAVFPGPYPGYSTLSGIAANGRVVSSGIRVCTTSSATNNQGVITIGCLPRSAVSVTTNGTTIDGFPFDVSTTATQGYNEFFNYLQTESYPLKNGASAFYRPEDPLDFTFRGMVIDGAIDIGAPADLTPFMVVGVTGAQSGSYLLVEIITHIEYTVTSGTTGVVNTDMGYIAIQDVINAGRQVFGGLVDSTIQGVTGGLGQRRLLMGSSAPKPGQLRITDSGGNYFSNTNNVGVY